MSLRKPKPATRSPSLSPPGTPAWLAVVRAYNLCDAVMATRLAALGLRLGEHEVLVNLLSAPGLTQQELAVRCFVAKSGVSMLVSRMQAQGLLGREADTLDARLKRLTLTPRGRALAERAMAVQAAVVSAMAAPVSAAELATVHGVMQRVSGQLENLLAQDKAEA
jgi:DNA-binding MarR family transcriptional regulator